LGEGATLGRATIEGGEVPLFWHPVIGAPMVAFFHGNGGQLARSVATGEAAAAVGLGFAGIEYPGYGQSKGPGPSEEGLLEAARAGLDVLETEGFDSPVCMGHSLGTGVAVAMAAEGRCSRLVLAAAYTSIAEMAQREYPFVPVRWLVLDRFDSLARADLVTVPTLVLHGTHDDKIPIAMGETIARAIAGARFARIDAGHNDLMNDELWGQVAMFLGE
jgi:pimeloyl-ACP methyl ester carboxylesterase